MRIECKSAASLYRAVWLYTALIMSIYMLCFVSLYENTNNRHYLPYKESNAKFCCKLQTSVASILLCKLLYLHTSVASILLCKPLYLQTSVAALQTPLPANLCSQHSALQTPLPANLCSQHSALHSKNEGMKHIPTQYDSHTFSFHTMGMKEAFILL